MVVEIILKIEKDGTLIAATGRVNTIPLTAPEPAAHSSAPPTSGSATIPGFAADPAANSLPQQHGGETEPGSSPAGAVVPWTGHPSPTLPAGSPPPGSPARNTGFTYYERDTRERRIIVPHERDSEDNFTINDKVSKTSWI